MDNQKNNFSSSNSDLDFLFKEALQNNSVPTDDHVWRRIQNGLADKSTDKKVATSITKRSSFPIWSAVSGIAASLLIWAIFFGDFTQNSLDNSTDLSKNSVAVNSKIENTNKLNNIKNNNSFNSNLENKLNNKEENNQENQNKEATSSNLIASKEQQIPPTINTKNTPSKISIKTNPIDINRAVASLEKDQTKNKSKTFTNPSTQISQNVWASDFVVQSSGFSPSLKKETNNTTTHQLNLDNQTVAITIKVGKNGNFDTNQANQVTDFEANQNPSQFDKAKNVLKEVWNLKTGKKVNLQNILPNNANENEQSNQKTTTNQSNSNNEIQAD